MIRLSKLADYGIVLMTFVARLRGAEVATARLLADETGLPQPTVSKILKALARGGLLKSQRGAYGGYSLARAAQGISVAEVIRAIEGPISLTECSGTAAGGCGRQADCPAQRNWQKINNAVVDALGQLTLVDMQKPTAKAVSGRRAGSYPRRVAAAQRGSRVKVLRVCREDTP